jgi:1,4-alpha-glucan branching enzyme
MAQPSRETLEQQGGVLLLIDAQADPTPLEVVANFSNVPLPSLNIGLPRAGQWHVRLNSSAKVYDPSFENGDSFDTTANPGGKDGLNFNANVGVGPYSVVILSQ